MLSYAQPDHDLVSLLTNQKPKPKTLNKHRKCHDKSQQPPLECFRKSVQRFSGKKHDKTKS